MLGAFPSDWQTLLNHMMQLRALLHFQTAVPCSLSLLHFHTSVSCVADDIAMLTLRGSWGGAGVGGGSDRLSTLVLAGLAGLVGGALSMAVGEFISVSSQRDAEKADIAREVAEQAKGAQSSPQHCLWPLLTCHLPDLLRLVAAALLAFFERQYCLLSSELPLQFGHESCQADCLAVPTPSQSCKTSWQ